MSSTRRRFSQEFKDELCREVIDSSKPIKSVATEYGVGAETLRSWLKKYKEAHGGSETEPELNVSERARLKELERENQELKAVAAFIKKAAAYFAREPR
jgi:transposase